MQEDELLEEFEDYFDNFNIDTEDYGDGADFVVVVRLGFKGLNDIQKNEIRTRSQRMDDEAQEFLREKREHLSD